MRNTFKTISVNMGVYRALDDLMYDMRLPSFNSLLSIMIPVMKEEIREREEIEIEIMLDQTRGE